jgi:hypothetical protein
MTVRDRRVVLEVSAFVIRREPPEWLAEVLQRLPQVLVGIETIIPIFSVVVGMERNGALVLAGVSGGTRLVLPGDTLLRRAVSEVMTSAFGWRCQVWWCH